MPLRHGRRYRNQRIERIVTASVGLVWSGQHLVQNAQRQNAPAHSTPYFAITIEGKKIHHDEGVEFGAIRCGSELRVD